MGRSAANSTQYLFELVEQLKSRAAGRGLSLPDLAGWIAAHWTGDMDYCNELGMFIANPGLDFELRAELFDRIYQLGRGSAEDLLVHLLSRGKHWDPQMTGVLLMIDEGSGRLRESVLALRDGSLSELEWSQARARIGMI